MPIRYLLILLLPLIACRQETTHRRSDEVVKYFFYPDVGDLRGVSLGDDISLLHFSEDNIIRKDTLGICLMESLSQLVEVETCFLAPRQNVEAVYSVVYFNSYSEALRSYKALVKFLWHKYKQAPFGSFGENKWLIEKRDMSIKLILLDKESALILNFYKNSTH